MSTIELVRAWKDEDYRLSLSPDAVPTHPAGVPQSELYASQALSLNTCEFATSCFRICSN
ncbi:mersacidin/lichenicidin family type 2 lantibiotic [Fodinicola feengrottensis]|uniref:Mersacidin/lichenicidin family type 2 lantibiotic n=1 Tax=Fodinicola feengrottensis TaxID=435914 RepID=A0ABN2I7T2_9ACTN|nr:mersacidin/lichenicidin family type 2 lantibiotic [Fodinicola feengrottensis]